MLAFSLKPLQKPSYTSRLYRVFSEAVASELSSLGIYLHRDFHLIFMRVCYKTNLKFFFGVCCISCF